MMRMLPDTGELLVFAAVAAVGALIVSHCSASDLALAGMSAPIFIAAAILGMRRNEQLRMERAKVAIQESRLSSDRRLPGAAD